MNEKDTEQCESSGTHHPTCFCREKSFDRLMKISQLIYSKNKENNGIDSGDWEELKDAIKGARE